MRTLSSGKQEIKIRASNLAYTIFYQEFNSNLSDELKPIEIYQQQKSAIKSVSKIDDKMINALLDANKADVSNPQEAIKVLSEMGIAENPELLSALMMMSQGGMSESAPIYSIMKVVWAMNAAQEVDVPSFNQWVEKYDEFDFVNSLSDIYDEIQRGFFRSENKK